nr:sulfotransferase [Maricaulis sp.]
MTTSVQALRPHVLAIGALGGSGTRAVAEAFEKLGYRHGPALNRSRDCLAFTYLFVRTGWMGTPLPAPAERLAAMRAIAQTGDHRLAPPLDALTDAIVERSGPAGSAPFMIKEPNSHMFADAILESWPDAGFLFVHRHPLDMAFSANLNQLKRWGPDMGIAPERFDSVPAAQLEVWIRAYKAQMERQVRYPGRTAMLDYERFVETPSAILGEVWSALGGGADPDRLDRACQGVFVPQSRGRWREADLSQFTAAQREFCADHGWL